MKSNQLIVINSGSSSIKFATYEFDAALKKTVYGMLENIHIAPVLKIFTDHGSLINEEKLPHDFDYDQFYQRLLAALESNRFHYTISAVGHRVVHGGTHYQAPVLVNHEIIRNLKELVPFAPLHQPYNIKPIEYIAQSYPTLPQVACFDTAFHRTHPLVADCFGVPQALTESGVRRYGFHGLSYEYIVSQLHEMDPKLANGRLVVAHLGNGASMCAIKNGKSMDTTMGFTALDGLVMGTRCGNLDPGVILYLAKFKHLSYDEIENLLYKKSGLLGVSGITSDMKALLSDPSPAAKMAIELYVYRIRRELGALTAVLGGLDALVFTGGIGEHAWQIREQVCRDNEWLGLHIDPETNQSKQLRIHDKKSKVAVYVMPTDEEKIIATHTYQTIAAAL